jgi:hypothetical protein
MQRLLGLALDKVRAAGVIVEDAVLLICVECMFIWYWLANL